MIERDHLFDELWGNHDVEAYQTAVDVLNGEHAWMERLVDNLYRAGAGTPAVAAVGGRQGAAAG